MNLVNMMIHLIFGWDDGGIQMDHNFRADHAKITRRTGLSGTMKTVIKLLTAAVFLCHLGCTSAAHSAKETGIDNSPAVLRDIRIIGSENNTEIEILLSKPLQYRLYNIAEPPRGVIDLSSLVLNPFKTPIDVKSSVVSRIDILKVDSYGRPVTRIIFKLKHPEAFSASTDKFDKNKIIMTVAEAEKNQRGTATPASNPETFAKPGHNDAFRIIRGVEITRKGIYINVNGVGDDFKFFRLAGPQRLVIDVFGARNAVAGKLVPVNRFGIRSVRLGTYPDKTRIVFDASKKIFPQCRIRVDKRGIKVLFEKNSGKATRSSTTAPAVS